MFIQLAGSRSAGASVNRANGFRICLAEL